LQGANDTEEYRIGQTSRTIWKKLPVTDGISIDFKGCYPYFQRISNRRRKVPIYEYLCDECEHKLEIIQKISDEPMRFCPECGKESLRKLISPVSFRLKGTGWYETDFKTKKKEGEGTKPDVKDTKESKTDTAGKSETKDTSGASGTKAADKTVN